MKQSVVSFGEFQIDRQACSLTRHGHRIALQIQSFRVLEVLIEHAGEVVTRPALRTAIWPDNVYLDFDHGLNNAINRIRQALGDSGENPRFIETLPRIGYRFIHALESPRSELPTQAMAPVLHRRRKVAAFAAGALLLAIAGAAVVAHRIRSSGSRMESAPAAPHSMNAQANDAYLRGLRLIAQRNKEAQKRAIHELQVATELDATFAQAYAVLAQAYASAGGTTQAKYLHPQEALGPALAAAEKALHLDPNLGIAHLALARVLNSLQPWSRANDLAIDQSFRRGLELDPGNADGHLQYGNFLGNRNRAVQGMVHFRRAHELDPMSPSVSSRLGQELMATGATREGLNLLKKTVELEPFQLNARDRLGWAYLSVNELDAAEQQFMAAEKISPGSLQTWSSLSFIASRRGDFARAREYLARVLNEEQSESAPLSIAIAYVGLKDRERSLAWLTQTVRRTRALHRSTPWSLTEPMYDWLRDDLRFKALEKEIASTSGEGSGSDR